MDKKRVAAIIAVLSYLKAEEEPMQMQVEATSLPKQANEMLGAINLWRVSGRQSQMQMRSLMQMKTFQK
ncbi:MAG: hypothetical protein HQK79_07435 [Desulfobacterales bacterium]|nr:hypothetical protein [Desulfobacterales bacterium]MBF0395559.1 hypothetical protein [Desulfobacterales bacterium]